MSERFYFSVGKLRVGPHYVMRMTEQDFEKAKRFLGECGYRALFDIDVPIALTPYALDLCEEFMHGKRTAEETKHALSTLEERTIAAEPRPIRTLQYSAARILTAR